VLQYVLQYVLQRVAACCGGGNCLLGSANNSHHCNTLQHDQQHVLHRILQHTGSTRELFVEKGVFAKEADAALPGAAVAVQ